MPHLSVNERKTLLALRRLGGRASVSDVAATSGLIDAAVMRATLSLTSKGLVRVHERGMNVVSITDEGLSYAKEGLPERRLLNSLLKLGGEARPEEAAKHARLNEGLLQIALGWLLKKGWANLYRPELRHPYHVLSTSREQPLGEDERLLSLLSEKGPLTVESLSEGLRKAVEVLRRRGIVNVKRKVERELELTEEGWRLVRRGIRLIEEVSQLTPELIATGRWRDVKLKRFDVLAPGPALHPGRAHPLQRIIQEIREVFLEMGFTEVRGPLVETAFWNFDALFQPQDHPAREMQDTFYLAEPSVGELMDVERVKRVAKVHEDGWITGSSGWRYSWDFEEAKRLVLRTHTTATTIRYLAEHKKPPIRVFSIDRVYRNEKVDYKHLAEFHQIEGIIMDKGVTFRDLLGVMKEFHRKLGLRKVLFRPTYFPYTEPSAQAMAYLEKKRAWLELCGMGVFRPEVLAPLDVKHPVLAWGAGLERLAMLKLGVEDVRLLYKNDLRWVRGTPVCLW